MALIILAVVVYPMTSESISLFWPYRDYALVRFLLAFLSGGHLEELCYETESFL
jgi:hypothetical protein